MSNETRSLRAARLLHNRRSLFSLIDFHSPAGTTPAPASAPREQWRARACAPAKLKLWRKVDRAELMRRARRWPAPSCAKLPAQFARPERAAWRLQSIYVNLNPDLLELSWPNWAASLPARTGRPPWLERKCSEASETNNSPGRAESGGGGLKAAAREQPGARSLEAPKLIVVIARRRVRV